MEEIDHRIIGSNQDLFFSHELSPGCPFFLPKGAKIYNKLLEFIRNEYYKRDFSEVITPVIFKKELWEISDHWNNYRENMFNFNESDQIYSIKSMNCPSHCLIFKKQIRSHKELPLRFADFGVLHRNEASGSLTGLTRVRKFSQDDAHIFCMKSQIKKEIEESLNFLKYVYDVFNFEFEISLSTRPEKFIGEIEIWDYAEKQLTEILNNWGKPWKINECDGAFYGPKIDIELMDSKGKKHQCGTIQLDFNLPERFNLSFVNESGISERPVIIHRAIYGSFERFFAILCEHYNGKWPFWLSPNQFCIIPVKDEYINFAKEISQEIKKLSGQHKFSVDIDLSDNTLKRKIRNSQLALYNYIIVVGKKELEMSNKENKYCNIRSRNINKSEMVKLDHFIKQISDELII